MASGDWGVGTTGQVRTILLLPSGPDPPTFQAEVAYAMTLPSGLLIPLTEVVTPGGANLTNLQNLYANLTTQLTNKEGVTVT